MTAGHIPTPNCLALDSPMCENTIPRNAIGIDRKQVRQTKCRAVAVSTIDTAPITMPAVAMPLAGMTTSCWLMFGSMLWPSMPSDARVRFWILPSAFPRAPDKYPSTPDAMRSPWLIATLLLASLTVGSVGGLATTQSEVVVTVDSTQLRFSPSTVTITEGESVRFFWSGEALPHNAVARDGLFDSGEPAREVDYTFTFEIGTNGTHEYVCEPHEAVGMIGTVVVEPAPVDVGPIEPDPTLPVEPPSESSGESWIPFFGLEVVFLSLLVILIYQYGRNSGMAETSFLTPDDSGSDEE